MNTINAPFKKLNDLIKPPNRSRLRLTYDDPFDMPDKVFEKLLEIMKKDPTKRIHQEINIIMHYLNSTDLMQKLKNESEFSAQSSFEHLMFMCAANLNFREVKKDEIIFDIDHVGDYFYILFLGKLAVKKPKELPKERWSQFEYFEYLNNLISKKEFFLLNKTLLANHESFPIKNFEQFCLFKKYLMKLKILDLVRTKSYEDFIHLINKKSDVDLESNYGYNLLNFLIECGLDFEYLKKLGENETNAENESGINYIENEFVNPISHRKVSKSSQKSENMLNSNIFPSNNYSNATIYTWVSYLQHKIEISLDEMINFEKIEEGMKYKKQKRDFKIFEFEVSFVINQGQYFGDYALDNRDQKRTARVQAIENSIIGFISNDIYSQYIKNEKRKIRIKEFSFINEFLFFNKLNLKKNFVSDYYLLNFEKGRNLFERGKKFENMFLIKEGEVVITFFGTIIDLFEMMEQILKNFEIILNQKLNGNFQLNKYVDLSSYIKYLSVDEKNFRNLKNKSLEYINYINKKRSCDICIMSSKEICGMEEFFLGAEKYFTTATVISKNSKVYKLGAEKVKTLINEENQGIYSILKNSVGKVVSLIKRIENIKRTWMEKFEENNQNSLLKYRYTSNDYDFANKIELERNVIEDKLKKDNSNYNYESNKNRSFYHNETQKENNNKDKNYNKTFHHYNHAIYISSNNNNKNWTYSDLQLLKHKKTQSENVSNFLSSRYSLKNLTNKTNFDKFSGTNEITFRNKFFSNEKREKPKKEMILSKQSENSDKLKLMDKKKFSTPNNKIETHLDINNNNFSNNLKNSKNLHNDHKMRDVSIQTYSLSNIKTFVHSPNLSEENLSLVMTSPLNSQNNLPHISNLKLNTKSLSSDINPKLQISYINFQDVKKSNLSLEKVIDNSNKIDKFSFLNTMNIPKISNYTIKNNNFKVEEIKNMKKTFQIPFVKRMKKIKLAKIKKENKNSNLMNKNLESIINNDVVVEFGKKIEKVVDLHLDEDYHNTNKELNLRCTVSTVKDFFKIKKKKFGYGELSDINTYLISDK